MFFFIISGSIWAYYELLEPAYVSVVDSCGIKDVEEIGYENVGYYVPSNDEIKIVIPTKYKRSIGVYKKTKEYNMFLKHEICHRNQKQNNRLNNNCNQLVRFWIDEVECYIKMRF